MRWLALGVALSAGSASAQLLDLDRPEIAAIEEAPAARSLAELLIAQAELIDTRESDSAPAELRRLAAVLLTTGRPIPTLIGRTMAARMDELESLAASESLDDVDRLLLVSALRRAQTDIPISTDQLDRVLRVALMRLGGSRESAPLAPGWVRTTAPDVSGAPSLEGAIELVAGALNDPGALDPCERLGSMVRTASERPLYAPAGERLSERLRLACAILHDPPAWLPGRSVDEAASGIARACGLMLDPATRRVGADLLERYAGLNRLIRACDRLEASNEVRALREALAARLADPPAPDAIEAVSRGLIVAAGDPVFTRDESEILRQLRPVWRHLSRRATLESRGVVPRLAPMLGVDSPLTDPATLAVLTSSRAPSSMARTLIALSDLLDDDPDGPSDRPKAFGERREIADRLLAITSDMDEPESETSARAELELLLSDLQRVEALIRANPEGAPLADLCVRARDKALIAWGDGDADPAGARSEIRRLERLTALRRAAALVEPLRSGGARVQRWAGVELSEGAVEFLSKNIAGESDRATRAALGGNDRRTDRTLDTLEGRYIVVRTLLVIEDRLRERSAFEGEHWSVLSEIALGPPGEDAWLVDHREQLAILCSLSEELVSASIRDDRPAERDLRDALKATAERLLRATEGR